MEFAAKVGEALLSASVQTLLDRISSSEFRDFMKNRKLNVSLLDELKITLLMLGAVLNDAEEKQITRPEVKEWLEELKDAIYDAEDLLDEINTESLRCKVEQDSQNVANKVRSFFSSSFGQFYWGLNSKLEATSRRLEHFAKRKDILGLQSVSFKAHKTPTTSVVNESVVVGREDDKEKLLKMLLCDGDPNPTDVGVVTIWGMGGLGKTTLAQLLYNDKKVQEHFDLKAWACVSDDFNILEVTKNLFESITKKVYDGKNLYLLRVELRNSLSNRRFLIVLDDLWNEKYSDWDDLITPFHNGKRGSKIIVTTRQPRVAEITHTFPVHKLSHLSDDNCWSLISKHAFANVDSNKYPELEAIGRKIARKCGGLPIAAKTMGGLLRSKVDAREWNKILNSNQWNIPNDDVMPALRLSYLYLPSHLKKCFAYCSIFPKDVVLEKRKLALLWMAEGIVQQQSHGDKTFEIEAEDCFNELLSRSFFEQYGGNPKKFVMHDLINDLVKFVSGKSCVQFEGNEVPKSIRHLSFSLKEYSCSKECESFCHTNSLRTLLSQNEFKDWSPICILSRKVLHDLLTKLKCLRVLSLPMYKNIVEVPISIGNLQLLRYLNLSHTSIKRLPDVAFTLYNLQTLLLSNCMHFIELSEKIEKLINLRHLDISETALNEMPTQVTKLENLQNLSTFIVGKQPDGLGIKELKRLPHLQGKLSISNLQNVVDSMDALEANLKNREKFEELVLEWDCDTSDSQIVKSVLNVLQPSTNVKKLTINNYGGTSFPIWVGDSSFINIANLCVRDCSNCVLLPPFGELPSLKELSISGMGLVHTVGREFYCSKPEYSSFQPFPSLEILIFVNMPTWEEWILFDGEGAKFPFPQLKSLSVHDCPMLRGDMPHNLPSLTKVSVIKCKQLEAKSTALRWIPCIKELRIEQGEHGLFRALDDLSPDSLESLSIRGCDSLQSLPRMIVGSHCLRKLSLQYIPSIMSFPIDGLPTSLQDLEIYSCDKLEFLPQDSWQNYTSLEYLGIDNSCPSLKSFPLGCFPKLKELDIAKCCNLETFTHVGRSALPLESFSVNRCNKLRSMSDVHVDSLANLQHFSLTLVSKLESLPQGGLPSNLRSLILGGCNELSSIPIQDWGFQRLTSLSHLDVMDNESESDIILHNLQKNQLLPTSLVTIGIGGVSNLKLLEGKGLQHLTSLEELYFWNCKNLESLPEDSLPSSLLLLEIDGCPKLEERYDYEKGKHLSKIAHIPTIRINRKYYDP
ncbi:putative disease resistance RPP13-like protein 1 [Neltuma alba]|uniref:putative disease resistance RPP13-like protein 1 n=1 Tax=Neltuma alba TaxID=207710 RepID=UPI0010A439EC|nr:putative disease resistance RPP13-like protein 1 [Prosopis alba]